MLDKLPPSAQRVQDILHALGHDGQVQQLQASTRTAQEAADSVGCDLGQIVKSLVFQIELSDKAILALVSGVNRVCENKLSHLIGHSIIRPNADFVRFHTGFSIGGVAPIAHPVPLPCYIDEDLLQYETVWAAAGTPNALFASTPASLIAMTQGLLVDIKA